MFANIVQGSIIHVLSISNGVKYNACTVESLSTNNNNPYQIGGLQHTSPINIKVNMNGKSITIEGLMPNSNISRTSKYIVTDNKETMIAQVEGLLQTSKDIVDNIAKYKSNIKECNEVLKQLSPQYAKEADRDTAIADLYNKVGGLDTKLDSILSALHTANKKQ